MSNPKEKAVDLLLKYSILKDGHNHLVKQCALIAVDEILQAKSYEQTTDFTSNLWEKASNMDYRLYWQEVKQEIEKL